VLLIWLSAGFFLFLPLVLGVLDIIINLPMKRRWIFMDVMRSVVKLVVSLAWAIALPLFYVQSFNVAPQQIEMFCHF
jgi:callose synthase